MKLAHWHQTAGLLGIWIVLNRHLIRSGYSGGFKTEEIAAIQEGRPSGVLEACRRAVVACIPNALNAYFDVKRDSLLIDLGGNLLPFGYLSDGFRNMVAMVADIARRCATLNPQLEADAAKETPGVVLIDEIDLHLHPKWQRRVVSDLLAAFPKNSIRLHNAFTVYNSITSTGRWSATDQSRQL